MVSASVQRTGLQLTLAIVSALIVGCSPSGNEGGAEVDPAQGPVAAAKPVPVHEPVGAGTTALIPVRRNVAELPVLKSSSECNIDQLGEVGTAGLASTYSRVGAPLSVEGWVVREDGEDAPPNISLRLEDEGKQYVWEIDVPVAGVREDVAQARSNPAVANSGFAALVDLREVTPGRFHLYLAYQAAGAEFGCDNGVQFDVK